MTRAAAYDYCARITRESATSFYLGIRLMPREQRDALYAIYALARRIDDIADGEAPATVKLERLTRTAAALADLQGARSDPVFLAVADAATHYPIPMRRFSDLIDGAVMDVRGTTYERFDDLLSYCRCVAGSIGQLTLGVFASDGMPSAGWNYGDDLGVALQLTNILRDIDEDVHAGRLYLPREELAAFGCAVQDGRLTGPVAELIRFQAARAHTWFERGSLLLPLLDRHGAACVGAMARVYERVLWRIERRPLAVFERRPSLRRWERGWVAARSVAGALL